MSSINDSFSDIQILQDKWQEFSTFLFQHMQQVNEEITYVTIQLRRLQASEKIIEECKNDVLFMLKHKVTILSLDAELNKYVIALEKFRELNALTNSAVPNLVSEIFKSNKLKSIPINIKNLEERLKKLNDEINNIEKLRTGQSFSREVIHHYLDMSDFDKITKRQIMFYPILKTAKKNPNIESENIQSVSETNDNNIEQNYVSTNTEQNENENSIEEVEIIEEEPIIEDNQNYDNKKENVADISDRLEKLNNKFKNIFDRYLGLFNSMSKMERECYLAYVSIGDANIPSENETSDKLTKIIVNTLILQKKKQEVENEIDSYISMNDTDSDDYEYILEILKEYETLGNDVLKDHLLYSKDDITKGTKKVSDVYFLLDENNSLILPKEEKTQIMSLYGKLIDSTKLSNIRNEVVLESFKALKSNVGRMIFAQRINDYAISFVKVSSNEDAINDSILIVSSNKVNNCGYSLLQKETIRIVKKYEDEIKEQINQIEGRDEEYLRLQEELRRQFKDNAKSRGGISSE